MQKPKTAQLLLSVDRIMMWLKVGITLYFLSSVDQYKEGPVQLQGVSSIFLDQNMKPLEKIFFLSALVQIK